MATIFNRLTKYVKTQNVPFLTQDQRVELGKNTADYYFNHKEKYPIPFYRVPQIEPEGTFKVIDYPRVFNKQLDKIIGFYYRTHIHKENKINSEAPAGKNETLSIPRRKRIPIRK